MKDLNESVIDGTGNFVVKLRKNETTESLIRRFVKKTKKEKLLDELLERKYFKKPTTKRREALFKRRATLAKLKAKEKLELQLDD